MTNLGETFSADTAGEALITAYGKAPRNGRGGAGWRRRRRRLDVVGQRSTAREHAPVVRVILVDVPKETFFVLAELLTHLARQVVRTRQRPGQLHDII